MKQMTSRLALIGAMLALALLGGCGTEQAATPPLRPTATLTWTAAIGQMETSDSELHCSAVLVAQDVIVTASHCLFLNTLQRPASPNELIFRPNMGGLQVLPPSRGTAFLGQGAVLRAGKLRNEDVSKDWVLVQISPPVTAVPPISVANLTIDGMLHMIGSGNRLVTAGYGSGGYEELKVHDKCRLLSQKELGLFPDDSWLQLDCIFRVGDSGGGIILLDGANQPALIGIITGFGHMPRNKSEPLGLGVNASQFLPYLRQPVSQAAPAPDTSLAGLPAN
jgi:protease YdgD